MTKQSLSKIYVRWFNFRKPMNVTDHYQQYNRKYAMASYHNEFKKECDKVKLSFMTLKKKKKPLSNQEQREIPQFDKNRLLKKHK